MAQSKITGIAVVNEDKCKPSKCNQECRKICPMNKMGKYSCKMIIGNDKVYILYVVRICGIRNNV